MSFRDALESGDLATLRKHWAGAFPNMPQPRDDGEAEIVMHRARTEAESISLNARAYSHKWLIERGLPSGLPDRLKPSAERIYPRVALGVGISVNAVDDFLKPAMLEVRGAMEAAVMDADAEGRIADAAFVKARMDEAKHKAMRAIFGRLTHG